MEVGRRVHVSLGFFVFRKSSKNSPKGAFKCYVTQVGVEGVSDFPEKSVTNV